ncbi:MAG: 4-alpha-glucanotransferase [Saprospiraceae bacterium]
MILQFHIHYKTVSGHLLALQYQANTEKQQIVQMQSYDGENWFLSIEFEDLHRVEYRYVLQNLNNTFTSEWGENRILFFPEKGNRYFYINDFWRNRDKHQNAFLSSAFTEAIFSRKQSKYKPKSVKLSTNNLEFHVPVSLPEHLQVGLIGNLDQLGKWLKPVPMEVTSYPIWSVSIPIDDFDIHLQYKYVIMDKNTKEITDWEIGDNRIFRRFLPEIERYTCIIHDQQYRSGQPWKGAGVAIPVFSLRSKKGFGIGEFSDLLSLTDWSHSVALKVIQILPVNDTIANKTWQDSYPYAAISVFALHPLYVNVQKMGTFKDSLIQKQWDKELKEINKTDTVDFEKVLEKKWFYFQILFQQDKETLAKNKTYQLFKQENSTWLTSYASFCVLRDQYNTCIFSEWKTHKTFQVESINQTLKSDDSFNEKVEFYTYIQFHAHLQLKEARDYARSKGIALKGDLPIGIYRHSCDAWVAPHLYNMDEQAGAPPDDFSEMGQNWGFPTYNWLEMAKDDFAWWKARFQKLNEYFDALRIDHILGFFRIWQIPIQQVSGTLGLFNPRLPYSKDELINFGLTGSIERYILPFLTEEYLLHHFNEDPSAIPTFFDKKEEGLYVFRNEFKDQVSIQNYIKKHNKWKIYEDVLYKLFTEVIFIKETSGGQDYYNPRITVHTTYSFKCLDESQQKIVQELYRQYYFQRHDTFWKDQALWKLPALLDASNMLICGEDLGMIPHAVPGVMKSLNIMSLEIQRMPKGESKFGNVQEYPYFSVSSPSCHDMSTIRGWWEKDHEVAKEFYYNYMFAYGYTPMKCEPRIVQFIVEDHLSGPSMLTIFPLQDLVGMDADLRRLDSEAEQINEPSNPKHYWRFRFHMELENLLGQQKFNEKLRAFITKHRP